MLRSHEALAERRRWGADTRDEMWDGELHLIPLPSTGHQDFLGDLLVEMRALLKPLHPRL